MASDMFAGIYGHKCVLSWARKGQCPICFLIADTAEAYLSLIKFCMIQ